LGVSQVKNNRLPESKRTDIVEKLLANMRQLENLVNDMLLFSRSGFTGEEAFTIDSLLDCVQVALSTHTGQRTNVRIINNTDDISVVGNPHILQSAILNLINNAVEASGPSGQVTVHAYSLGLNTVDIKVQDDGCGVPDDIQEKIFDPFFTTRTNGTGLGLAVVRAIARAHRGEVWLESNPDSTLDSKKGEGSAFIMRLPTITNPVA
jgi:two-component system sensor histidine kinase FlrB